MPLENVSGIDDLNELWPIETDPIGEGNEQIQNIKKAVKATGLQTPREMTLSEAQAAGLRIGQSVILTDFANAPYTVVGSTDAGGFYQTGLVNGFKLRLLFPLDYCYVEWFGVKEGSDSSALHGTAATYSRTFGLELRALAGKTYTVDATVDLRSIRRIDYEAQITGSGNFVTVLLGGDSTNVQQYYQQSIFKANRGGAAPAIRIVGSNKNTIKIGEASIVEMYADTDSSLGGTDEYCAYNSIHIQSCTTLRFNSNAATDGSIIQWINKNDFYLQFIQNFEVVDNGYKHNGNHFYGGNFESGTSKIDFQTGMGNTFHNVRGENALTIEFGTEAANNNVLTDWFDSPNNPVAGATVIDNGLNNVVKNISDIYNDRVTILSFNGSSLKDDGAGNSNFVGVNAGLTKDAVNNTVTATANQLIYESVLIEVSPSREYFDLEVNPKLSGGIRMKIDGYDSNMNSIANTGNDVFYSGATNETAGFGENSTTVTNDADQRRIHIINSNAKYIKITVNASSAGVSFRRMTLECITGDKFGKKRLEASSQIYNV